MLTIGEYLLPSNVLLLHSPQPFSFFLLLAGHLSLSHLHLTLIHDRGRLLGVEALEVIWLDAVGRKH
jgi:hypothetical protein